MRNAIALSALMVMCISTTANASIVKKSKSGICHSTESSYYSRTKNFTSFSDLQSCLDSGGRLPKGFKAPSSSKQNSTMVGSKYKRSYFGHGWADVDRDCQDSRVETLIAQSVGPIRYKSSRQCKVESGRWVSSFTGQTIYSASKIDIDHVVPLKFAWERGAGDWPQSKREKFANDPANLLSVEASLNRQKGAKGLSQWLPPSNQCQYILRFTRVMKTYGVMLRSNEKRDYSKLRDRYCG